MIAGTLFVAWIGMVLFANAMNLGEATHSEMVSIVVATSALWITHIGFNIIQAAGCGLMLDLCQQAEELDIGTAAGSALNGLAGILAAFIGYIPFDRFLTFFGENEAVFYIGVVIVVLTTLPTLIVGKEKQWVLENPTTIGVALKDMFYEIRHMNSAVIKLFFLVALTAMVQYPWSLYFTHYIAVDVYKGDPDAPDLSHAKVQYEDGVRMGSLVTGFMDTFTLICAIPLSAIVRIFGHKSIYMIGNLWGIVGYGFPAWPTFDTLLPAITLAVSTGLFQATTNSLQWTLLGLCIDESKSGVYAGILNVVQTIGELLSSAIAGLIIDHLPRTWGLGKIAPGIGTGGIWGLISIPFILALVVKTRYTEEAPKEAEEIPQQEVNNDEENVDDRTRFLRK